MFWHWHTWAPSNIIIHQYEIRNKIYGYHQMGIYHQQERAHWPEAKNKNNLLKVFIITHTYKQTLQMNSDIFIKIMNIIYIYMISKKILHYDLQDLALSLSLSLAPQEVLQSAHMVYRFICSIYDLVTASGLE